MKLRNLRAYRAETTIQIGDITALIGKNDAGKSTILEALDAVLGTGKLDPTDVSLGALDGDALTIECAFEDLPAHLTLDAGSRTNLADERLVDATGRLRVRWSWPIRLSPDVRIPSKPAVSILAHQPRSETVHGLHGRKNVDLKKTVKELGLEADCDLKNNAAMRSALWKHVEAEPLLTYAEVEVDVSKEDGKSIWEQLTRELPLFVLFRADRPSTDQDAEVQDPMKLATRAALQELSAELEAIAARVREKAMEVATRTITKLREFDAELASTLTPTFADPKLESAFKLSLVGDDGISVNKRGSGVRRLILFSFFRAEAERRRAEEGRGGIIYAIEEPETAQHPNYQRLVVETLLALSHEEQCQVLITTHVPGLAALLPLESLRLVERAAAGSVVRTGADDVYEDVVKTLGIVPDRSARVLLCVEGPHDINFLRRIGALLRQAGESVPDVGVDPAIGVILLGGSTLANWVNGNLLRGFGLPEFHIYDRDSSATDSGGSYADHAATVNIRGGWHSARLTTKREMENYLHPAAVERVLGGLVTLQARVSFGDLDDVEKTLRACVIDHRGNPQKKIRGRTLKSWLNDEVAAQMTAEELADRDPHGEILGWFKQLQDVVANGHRERPRPPVVAGSAESADAPAGA